MKRPKPRVCLARITHVIALTMKPVSANVTSRAFTNGPTPVLPADASLPAVVCPPTASDVSSVGSGEETSVVPMSWSDVALLGAYTFDAVTPSISVTVRFLSVMCVMFPCCV